MTSHSIPRTTPKYQTVDDIMSGSCEGCGGPLSVDFAHLGGYSERQAFVVYDVHSETCPLKGDYYIQHIPLWLALEVDDLIHFMDLDFGLQQEGMEVA